jgi:hypothetical protein
MKQTRRLKILLLALLLTPLVATVLPSNPVSALSQEEKEECYQKWAGGYYRGPDDNIVPDKLPPKKITLQQLNNFRDSKCVEDENCQESIPSFNLQNFQGIQLECEAWDGQYHKYGTYLRPQDDINRNQNQNQNQNEDDTTDIGTGYNEDDCKAAPRDIDSGNCEIVKMIVIITNVLSGLAATVIVAMIVWGGIQYSMAGADAAKVQAAKQKIMNALIALLLLVFGFSIIQWLVPGGLI